MEELLQSTAYNLMIFMVSSTDHISGATGLTLTISASKDGAAFASITPTVTERGTGWYNLALTTTHTNTLGDLAFHITGSGADPTDFKCKVVSAAASAAAIWDEAMAGHTTAGTAGAYLLRAQYVDSILKNTASQRVVFLMTDLSTYAPLPGLSDADFTTKQAALDTAAPGTLTGTVTALGNGYYYINLTQAETNATQISFTFECAAVTTVTSFTLHTFG